MKAAWYSRNGDAHDVITVGEQPTPQPEAGQLRVRLATSGVNPSDVKSRQHRPVPNGLCVPHSDGAGIIDAVGVGVDQALVGRRVWVWNGQWQRALGTCAEYIVVPQSQAVPLPDTTDYAAGACLGIPALTACRAVQLLGDIQGKTILVSGASSSVGFYATQLAALAGARVIGTVGSHEKAVLAQKAGAAHTILYKTEPVLDIVKEHTGGRGADAMIDMDFSTTAGLLGQGLVGPHGVVACYGANVLGDIPFPFRSLLFASITLHLFLVYELLPADRAAAIAQLTALLEADKLMHAIGARYSLEETAKAHVAVEQGRTMGNIVIDIDKNI